MKIKVWTSGTAAVIHREATSWDVGSGGELNLYEMVFMHGINSKDVKRHTYSAGAWQRVSWADEP